jgi:hypothetical protein
MKPSSAIGGGAAVLSVLLSSATLGGAPAATAGPTHSVIVVMKNKLSGGQALSDQAPVMGQLARSGGHHRTKQFQAVNSLATTATDDEIAQLKANPAVAAVVPDVVIRHAKQTSATSLAAARVATSLNANVIPGACGANGKVLLDPEALQTTNTNSDDPAAKTARSLGFTGAGVVVAYIADGIDPNSVNFIRKNGKSAFIDYQDFSGDGPGQLTSGDEAFLDANSIAGQGLVKYNVANFGAQPDPGACNIRIEGMAPGASLVGLNVFGENEETTESNFLEAIDYAIQKHVDIINESFGGNPFPDVSSLDVTALFNEEAVKAGITVVVSSGDAGYTNTIGSPATDPKVIAVGGSTTFRFYAQTNYAAARYFATSGWLNDNISSLSSSGFSEAGSTIDVVAPGDLGFASCDANPLYYGCTNFKNEPSNVEESGGTSQSAPLTAGAAALVIEAYRNSHHGRSPTPAVVKQILTSTATDLGVPAVEQGSGLINSYKAVLLAQSMGNSPGSAVGQTLLLSESQLNGVGAPGSNQSWPVTVTNTGNQTQIVKVSGRTFGPYKNVQKGNVVLKDGVSPQFANFQGLQNNFATFKFTVPAGQDRLFAQLAYATVAGAGNNGRVRLILVDPKGRFAAHSLPQGVGDYGSAEVRQPVAGTWLGVIFGDIQAIGGTNTTIPWEVSTQTFTSFGSVSPSSLALAPGQSGTVRVNAQTPWTPGDTSGSVVLTSNAGGVDPFIGAESNSIPVTLRSTIDVAHGGKFNGTLTGGNGRPNGEGQIQFYQFNVGSGHQSITANVSLTNDPTNQIGAYLVAPDGTATGFGLNSFGSVATSTKNLTAFTLNPKPGLWTLIVDVAQAVVGNEISQPYSGNVVLDETGIKVVGVPPNQGQGLKAGTSTVVEIQVFNNTISPQAIFLDPRLNSTATYKLANLNPPTGGAYVLPLSFEQGEPEWLVPTQTSSVKVTANATLPVVFDYSPGNGDPDLFGRSNGDGTAQGSFTPTGGTVQQGLWLAAPSELGPYKGPAPSGSVAMAMYATTKAFDTSVTSPGGDFWLAAVDASVGDSFRAIPLQPGQSVTIPVTVTPSGPRGTKVKGTLYIDALENGVPPYGEPTGDEIAAFPYSYTIE